MFRKILILVFLSIPCPAVLAECTTSPFMSNSTVMGTLSISDCTIDDIFSDGDQSFVDVYQIVIDTTSTTGISMSAGTLSDPFLRLTQLDFTIIAEDDDSGSGFDALIEAQLQPDTYLVFANSATSSQSVGTYTITLAVQEVGGTDTDMDGIPDSSDADDDGDGVLDINDTFPLDASESLDSDGDGIGDNADVGIRLTGSTMLELPVVDLTLLAPDGSALMIPTDATAVSLNVTVVNPSGSGYVTVWPCGVPRPLASNLNYVAGDIVPNGVIASIGAGGKVCFYSLADTDLVVDVAGWFAGEAFVGVTPERLVDTRSGTGGHLGKISRSLPLVIPIAELAVSTASGSQTMVPANITAAAMNVTVVNPAGGGYVTVYPCDADLPLASNVNYVGNQIVANGVIAPVSASGSVCVYTLAPTDLVVDLAGWFVGSGFTGSLPTRLVDTRIGTGGQLGQLASPNELSVPVRGIELTVSGSSQIVPADATAVSLNVTVVDPASQGYVTVWPCGVDRPLASNLNYVTGSIVANNVIAPIGLDGSICLYSLAPTDIVVDISGWFTGDASNGFVGTTPKRLVDTRSGYGPRPQ